MYPLTTVSAELIAILSVGVGLAGLNLGTAAFLITWLRNIEQRMGALECRLAKLEGVLLARGLMEPAQ